MQIVGPHHASALEAFPAAAGVADREAADAHYMGSPGAGVEGAQQWQAPEPAPVDPRDATGPGKRKVPWEGTILSPNLVPCVAKKLARRSVPLRAEDIRLK